jgi:hypothetical protein
MAVSGAGNDGTGAALASERGTEAGTATTGRGSGGRLAGGAALLGSGPIVDSRIGGGSALRGRETEAI